MTLLTKLIISLTLFNGMIVCAEKLKKLEELYAIHCAPEILNKTFGPIVDHSAEVSLFFGKTILDKQLLFNKVENAYKEAFLEIYPVVFSESEIDTMLEFSRTDAGKKMLGLVSGANTSFEATFKNKLAQINYGPYTAEMLSTNSADHTKQNSCIIS